MISVALAAYKGEKYIAEQVNSILPQLGCDDEIVVSDDCPECDTYKALEQIIENDSRVRYIKGSGDGVIRNFENAIKHCRGDFIFMSDQDDVWLDGKVDAVMREFDKGADVVMHNADITDGELNKIGETSFDFNDTGTGFVKNLIKNTYQGCCMAFKADMKKYILPFPKNIPMHDQWIGLVGEKHGKVFLIKIPYILYRRHGDNVSGNGSSLLQKIKWRLNMLKCILGK